MNKLKVLVADDHGIIRAGLRLLINSQPDMEVTGEASDAQGTIQQFVGTSFDVVVIDLSMPSGNTAKAIESIRQQSPQTRILVLSPHDDQAYIMAVMTAGASGYVLKRSADSDFLAAIRAVHRGESYIDPNIAQTVLQGTVLKKAAAHQAESGKSRHILSQRECQVLKLIVDGHTNQEVADHLFLSVKTVETHRARLMKKLGLSTRADLIRYARQSGVLANAADG